MRSWYTYLQLTDKQWFIIQQFTARADSIQTSKNDGKQILYLKFS